MAEQEKATRVELPVVINLQDPIDVFEDGDPDHLVREIRITRKVQARDLMGMKIGGERTFGEMLELLASLTGQPMKVLEKLSMTDASSAIDVLGDLMGE
ncbi:hypothetical protein KQI63_15865 [bacterium]|nr:hypothetical protein [bacterium]